VETGLQISLEAEAPTGAVVVVIGLGAVGMITSWLLAMAGQRVIAVDPVPERRRAAVIEGVTAVAPEEVGAALAACGLPDGVPLVVEASGNPAGLRSALDLLAHEGMVLVGSWYGTKDVDLPLGGRFHRRRLTIRSTQVSTIPTALRGEWDLERRRRRAVELLGELPLERLTTHTFAFDDAATAFRTISSDAGVIHAALGYP
jgi:threonine dehydrogenase-like Zn-dependent dehydrogenase